MEWNRTKHNAARYGIYIILKPANAGFFLVKKEIYFNSLSFLIRCFLSFFVENLAGSTLLSNHLTTVKKHK